MLQTKWTTSVLLVRAAAALLAGAVLLSLPAYLAAAEPLPVPEGPVILVVSGNLDVTNTPEGAAFDRQMLEELGTTEVKTSTPWTDGEPVFSGVTGRAVLERIGAEGTTVTATALNDYSVAVPMEDFQNYDVLLATHMDGEEMKVSDKGPIWIVYPRDQFPELQNRRVSERWVWQLKALRVE